MVKIKVPYCKDSAMALWPTFNPSLEDKHGANGRAGEKGEQDCISLIEEHLPRYKICYDHTQDCVGQYFGIDLTCVSKDSIDTIDCKSGYTGLYWNREGQYWYITVKKDFFSPRKCNTHFMHVGLKGDVFVLYEKNILIDTWEDLHPIPCEYGVRIKLLDIKHFAETNL